MDDLDFGDVDGDDDAAGVDGRVFGGAGDLEGLGFLLGLVFCNNGKFWDGTLAYLVPLGEPALRSSSQLFW